MTEQRKTFVQHFVPVIIGVAIQTVAFVWFLSGFTHEVNIRLLNIENSLNEKASKESVSSLDTRVKTTERKIDRIDRTVAAHVGVTAANAAVPEGGP